MGEGATPMAFAFLRSLHRRVARIGPFSVLQESRKNLERLLAFLFDSCYPDSRAICSSAVPSQFGYAFSGDKRHGLDRWIRYLGDILDANGVPCWSSPGSKISLSLPSTSLLFPLPRIR